MFAEKIEGRVAAIADTHGCYEETKLMLNWLYKNKWLKDRWVVFLGDYVDEGPETGRLIELLLKFKKNYHSQTTFCCGNHDLNLAKALNLLPGIPHDQVEYYWDRITRRNVDVMRSYHANDRNELSKHIPDAHKDFLSKLPWLIEHPDYYFIHCGFNNNKSFDKQLYDLAKRDPSMFKPPWLHENRLCYISNSNLTSKKVISGHINANEVMVFDNRIVIDTGLGYGGSLTTLLLPEMQVAQTPNHRIGFQMPLAVK